MSILIGKLAIIKTPLNIPILLFSVLMITQYIAGRVTSSRFGTVYPYATKVYSLEILSYMLAFLVTANNITSRRHINRILFAIISTGGILAIYGIIQKSAGPQKIFWFRHVREVLLFYSSYVNCNYFAGYMNMVAFLALGAFLTYLNHLDKKRGYNRFDIFEGWNILFIFSMTMMALSIFHTSSQGGILTFLLSAIFFYFLYSEKTFARKSILIGISGSMFALTAVALIWIWNWRNELRFSVWARALNLVKINPISGTGLGTFQFLFPKCQPNIKLYFSHCHNDYLELLIEAGLIGFSIFLSSMSLFFKRYRKLLKLRHDPYARAVGYACLASAFSVFIYSFIDSNMHIGANALLFSVTLAIGSVDIHLHSHPDENVIFKRDIFGVGSRLKKIFLFIILLFCFLCFIAEVVSISIADVYATIGKNQKKLAYVRRAVALQGDSSEYRYLLAEGLSNGYLDLGVRDKSVIQEVMDNLKQAIRLNPNVSKYHRALGLMYSRIADNTRAVEELKRAQELDPYWAFNYLLLAVHYFNNATTTRGINPYGSQAMESGVLEYRKSLTINPSLTIDEYKSLLNDYPLVKETLKRYSL